MTNSNELRKVSDVLFSIEEKLITLMGTLSVQDMNNKLILDRLNKLLNQQNGVPINFISSVAQTQKTMISNPSTVELSEKAIVPRKQLSGLQVLPPEDKKKISGSKIPVVQRVTDNHGKDVFMADVIVMDSLTKEVLSKSQTNVAGKWQANLPVGKYAVIVSKVVDPSTLHKIELNQEIEISSTMKSLQLPVAIIKR